MPSSPHDLKQCLGSRLRGLRQAQGLSQEEIATRCGLSQKFLSELERGVKAPALETLAVLARDGFAMSLSTLLLGVDQDLPAASRTVETMLAGKSSATQELILEAVELLLKAGAQSE